MGGYDGVRTRMERMVGMKIKDLPEDTDLRHVQFTFPGDGKKYYWYSQWNKGVWGKTSPGDSRMYPLCINDLEEALEWEVVDGNSV